MTHEGEEGIKDDPFLCFGDDDDDGKEDENVTKNNHIVGTESKESQLPLRDSNFGVLTFHAGTEQSMLQYVQNNLVSGDDRPTKILKLVDTFCLTRHWMMHVGEKGLIVQDFLRRCCLSFRQSTQENDDNGLPFILLELGTYCGYSTILWAKTVIEEKIQNFHIFTVDVDKNKAKVAQKLIDLAGLSDYITIILLDDNDDNTPDLLSKEIEKNMHKQFPSKLSSINFLFIDHDKPLYLSDLKQLERNRWIQKGCFVAADNVLFHKINDYCKYIEKLSQLGIVETELREGFLEYYEPDCMGGKSIDKNQLRDGVELTIYLHDPTQTTGVLPTMPGQVVK